MRCMTRELIYTSLKHISISVKLKMYNLVWLLMSLKWYVKGFLCCFFKSKTDRSIAFVLNHGEKLKRKQIAIRIISLHEQGSDENKFELLDDAMDFSPCLL